eukprot:1715891-Prymnesium_polylepis.1
MSSTSAEDSLSEISRRIQMLELDISDIKSEIENLEIRRANAEKRAKLSGQPYDASADDKKRYEKRAALRDKQEELDFLQAQQHGFESAANRIQSLPSVVQSGARNFALILARELRRCYSAGELDRPVREDRGDPCFHSDIEHALRNLENTHAAPTQVEADACSFARKWMFARERAVGYRNLRDNQ